MVPLVAASCWEVFSRYVLGEPTLWAYEVGYMAMGTHFLVGLAYTLRQREHVRVDFFYSHVSEKARAAIDAFAYVVLLLPPRRPRAPWRATPAPCLAVGTRAGAWAARCETSSSRERWAWAAVMIV